MVVILHKPECRDRCPEKMELVPFVRLLCTMYASIIPSKKTTGVAPFLLMPAQTCTFVGCFARGFSLGRQSKQRGVPHGVSSVQCASFLSQ